MELEALAHTLDGQAVLTMLDMGCWTFLQWISLSDVGNRLAVLPLTAWLDLERHGSF